MPGILVLTNYDVGLYKFRKELLQELIDHGNTVYISLPNGEFIPSLQSMGCIFIETKVNRRSMNPFNDLKLVTQYYKLLKEIRPDYVITYTIKPNIYGGILARLFKISYAVNITGLGSMFQKDNLLKQLIIFLYKKACKRAKVIFFENTDNQNVFLNEHIISNDQACKLNGAGVNLSEFCFCEYPKENNNIRFLFIGRIMKEKGIDELFEAAKQICKEYNNVHFDILGPCEENYKEIIQELEDEDIIHYYGYQSDVKEYIKRSHCLVLASYHEGMSNTLLEASAMGRPVITSDIPGCREAVEDGKSGYLVQAKDVHSLLQKIIQFYKLPYEEKVVMGTYARNYIANRFDKKLVIKKTMDRMGI